MGGTSVPSPAEVEAIAQGVSNWGRWGDDDERGTLNLISAEKRAAAAQLVKDGVTVNCTRPIPVTPAADNPRPAQHFMIAAGDEARHGLNISGLEASYDYFGIGSHGAAATHVDALCHIFRDGKMYNGFDASEVRSNGAQRNSIMTMQDGIVSRGVLLDIGRVRGVDWLEPGERVSAQDLEAAEAAEGVRVEEGDILLVGTGRDARQAALGSWLHLKDGIAGLGVDCIPWLHERGVAMLSCDGASDTMPSGIEGWPMPIHQIVIVQMGTPLIDNMRLDGLAAACAERSRWEFQLTLAPLHLVRGTASPVNPIALF